MFRVRRESTPSALSAFCFSLLKKKRKTAVKIEFLPPDDSTHTKQPAKMKPSAQPSRSPSPPSCSQLAASLPRVSMSDLINAARLLGDDWTSSAPPGGRADPLSQEPICGEDGEEGKWSFMFLFVLCVPSLLLSVCHSLCLLLWISC